MSRGLKSVLLFVAFAAIVVLSRHAISNSSSTATTMAMQTTTTTGSVTTTTSQTTCQGSEFSSVFDQGEGAAGTITDSVTLIKKTTGTCVVDGYPVLTLQDTQGGIVTSTPVDLSPSNPKIQFSDPQANKAATVITVGEGASVTFSFAYSDVPTGATACPSVSELSVQFASGGSTVAVLPQYALQPCNNATLWISPFYS